MTLQEKLNNKCPICFPIDNLQSKFPNIAKQWHKDNNLLPSQVYYRSNYNAKWICENNHIWFSAVKKRITASDDYCPYCKNLQLLKGYNDLQTCKPYLLSQWDYDKNIILPENVLVNSSMKVYWKCENNHSYLAQINRKKPTCHKCKQNYFQSSFGEQAIYFYLYNIAKNRYKIHNKEIDIYIESLNIGIEFNGKIWHDKQKDLVKELYLSNYIKMFYVLESDKNFTKNNKIYFSINNYNKNLEWAIKKLFKMLNLNIKVDLQKDEQLICNNYMINLQEKSLYSTHKELLSEWSNKNILSPTKITPCSKKIVWWECDKGHEWQEKISNRTIKNNKCPFCYKRKTGTYKNLYNNFSLSPFSIKGEKNEQISEQ